MIIFATLKFLISPFPSSFKTRLKWCLLNLRYSSFFRIRTVPIPPIDNNSNSWIAYRKQFQLVVEYYEPEYLLKAPIICRTMYVKKAPKHYIMNNQISLHIRQIAKAWSYCFKENQNNLENWISTFGRFLEKAEEYDPKFIDKMNSSMLIEFGPGLGAAAILYSKHFKTKIVLFDLPEVISLRKIIFESLSKNGFIDDNSYEQCSDIDNLLSKKASTNFISTWAFTETPIELRKKIFPLLQRCKVILIVSNNYYEGVDNFSYLQELSKKLPLHLHFFCDLSFLKSAPNYQKKHQLHLYISQAL